MTHIHARTHTRTYITNMLMHAETVDFILRKILDGSSNMNIREESIVPLESLYILQITARIFIRIFVRNGLLPFILLRDWRFMELNFTHLSDWEFFNLMSTQKMIDFTKSFSLLYIIILY